MPWLALEFPKEGMIDLVGLHLAQPQFELLKHVDELLAINKLDRRNSIPRGLSACLGCKGSGRY